MSDDVGNRNFSSSSEQDHVRDYPSACPKHFISDTNHICFPRINPSFHGCLSLFLKKHTQQEIKNIEKIVCICDANTHTVAKHGAAPYNDQDSLAGLPHCALQSGFHNGEDASYRASIIKYDHSYLYPRSLPGTQTRS